MKNKVTGNIYVVGILAAVGVACGGGKYRVENFEVSGTISNNPSAKKIYLEEIPVTMDRILVDSVEIEKDGKFHLNADRKEATVYNLRIDQNMYPLASIINDTTKIIVDAKFNSTNNQFAESYEVKGSPASQQMKDFMTNLNTDLQKIFLISKRIDSLSGSGNTADSLINPLMNEKAAIAKNIHQSFLTELDQSTNPALKMFILGYYQSTANNPAFGISPLKNEEVSSMVNAIAAKYPEHMGVASIKRSLDAQLLKALGWVGKPAPDFTLPDVNGHAIKLSSFRGKYVLVDFWASWCKPCRLENPNIVKAYQQFKDKNFTILGVSLDRPEGKDQWIKAIKQDNLVWPQVSDLKFWDSQVVPMYKIEGIPFNVLVDPEGKIIAQALTGEALESKLREVLNPQSP